MAHWGNEILPFVVNSPFNEYYEDYDTGLFQYKANETELELTLEKFDEFEYGDTIRLTDGNLVITGYANIFKRMQGEHKGIVYLQSSHSIVNTEVERGGAAGEIVIKLATTPTKYIEWLSVYNSGLFDLLNISFGEYPLIGNPVFEYSGSVRMTKISYDIPANVHVNIKHNVIVYRSKYDENIWAFTVVWSFYSGDSNTANYTAGFYYDRSGVRLRPNTKVDNEANDWVEITDEDLTVAPYIYHALDTELLNTFSAIEAIQTAMNNRKCVICIKDQKRVFVFVFSAFGANKLPECLIYAMSNYIGYLPSTFKCLTDKQPISNILSDFCFLYNSYFTIKEFNHLYIRPNYTGINEYDLKLYDPTWILSYNQIIGEREYQDYSWRAIGPDGENAFGFDDTLSELMNNYYKTNKGAMTTEISIYRGPGFPVLQENDSLYYDKYRIGIIRTIGYSNDGKQYDLKLIRELTTISTDNWLEI